MKTIAYILCLAVFVTACTKTPQTIAEKEVKSFLKLKLKNPGDYKAISFEKLDTITEADTLKLALDYYNMFVGFSADSQKIKQAMAAINERLATPGLDTNIVYYSIIHKYSHLGLDNEKLELEVRFILDKNFKVLHYDRGIQGQAYFDVAIATDLSEYYKIDRYELDGKPYSTSTVRHRLPYGKHTIRWWKADKMLMSDDYLPLVSYNKEFWLMDNAKDTVPGIRILVISGDYIFTYNSKEEVEKSEKTLNAVL
ncbi:MAG TPA: hypothetical protein PK252_11030 [Bacteroidales bacterium]|nr:hypothetical protein [Bacteroidales bacterium]